MRRFVGALLAFLAGIMLISVNWTGKTELWARVLDLATRYASDNLAETYSRPLTVAIGAFGTIIFILAGLGGVSVIAGAVFILAGRVGLGKFVIGLGTGVSILSLLFLLGSTLMKGASTTIEFLQLMLNSIGWLGVIISIIARRIAR